MTLATKDLDKAKLDPQSVFQAPKDVLGGAAVRQSQPRRAAARRA